MVIPPNLVNSIQAAILDQSMSNSAYFFLLIRRGSPDSTGQIRQTKTRWRPFENFKPAWRPYFQSKRNLLQSIVTTIDKIS